MAARSPPHLPSEGTPLRPLPRSFYARPSPAVAPDLLGRFLVRDGPAGRVVARIVECEAYQEDDPASHSYRGLTNRTAVMFGPPGHLYVYFSYGAHWCMNVVTGTDGEGSAVLLRAAEPMEGLDLMQARRGRSDRRLLCAGPGRLTQAFGVTGADNGLDLTKGTDLCLAGRERVRPADVGVSPRVGISVAQERPWRFFDATSRFVSRGAKRSLVRVDP